MLRGQANWPSTVIPSLLFMRINAPDVGIFASTDPVAIDMASRGLVNNYCGKEIFKEFHPGKNPMVQLEYAQRLGVGHLDYELIRI